MVDSTFARACEEAAARFDVPALAVGISSAGRRDSFAVGCDVDTRFRIASITKPFVATTALALLDLGADCGIWPHVTIADLLAHMSGYECEHGDVSRFGEDDDALARVVSELGGVRQLVPPHTVWSYSNAGYWIVGLRSAEALGSTFEDAVYETLIDPWSLEATRFGTAPDVGGSGPGATDEPYPRVRRPSGGLVSNVADLLRFGEQQLRSPETAVLRTPRGRPPAGVYGLGFDGERVAGVDVWGHPGSYGGFQSSLMLLPDRDAVFVGLTSSGRGKQALRRVEDLFFRRLLGAPRRVPETVTLPRSELEAFAGEYRNDDESVTVDAAGNGLTLSWVEDEAQVEAVARPIGSRAFEIVGGDYDRDRLDFPLPGFARFGSRLSERVLEVVAA